MVVQFSIHSECSESLNDVAREYSGAYAEGTSLPKRDPRYASACSRDSHEACIFSHIRGLSNIAS